MYALNTHAQNCSRWIWSLKSESVEIPPTHNFDAKCACALLIHSASTISTSQSTSMSITADARRFEPTCADAGGTSFEPAWARDADDDDETDRRGIECDSRFAASDRMRDENEVAEWGRMIIAPGTTRLPAGDALPLGPAWRLLLGLALALLMLQLTALLMPLFTALLLAAPPPMPMRMLATGPARIIIPPLLLKPLTARAALDDEMVSGAGDRNPV
jgi:hypothetical protein